MDNSVLKVYQSIGMMQEIIAQSTTLDEALREYFTTHEDIHVRELARIGHYAMSTAYRKLKAYVEQGKLELLPKSSSYYRWVGE